jgi:Tol biopolymer transport system component
MSLALRDFAVLMMLGNVIAGAAAHASAAPSVFAPGLISGPADDEAPTFTPDGRTVYFFRGNSKDYYIMESHRVGARWSTPRIASFSGHWRDLEPALAPDGSYLIFASSRPLPGSDSAPDGSWGGQSRPGKGGNLWRVNRTRRGWSEPIRLPDTVNRSTNVFSPSIAANGNLYFMEAEGEGMVFRLFMSPFKAGVYQAAVPLPFTTGKWGGVDPAVAPDESFLIYSSNRPPAPAQRSDLFIVFRKDGEWGEPQHLDDKINAYAPAFEARIGPDAHSLYFASSLVVQTPYPKKGEDARRSLADMEAWNNGSQNIWQVDISDYVISPGR